MFNNDFLVIEFGYKNIKIIVAALENKGVKIKCMDLIPTIEGSILNGRIVDVNKVVGQISNYLISNNIKTKKAILTVTCPSIIMREFAVLNHKKNVIKSFIDIEADNFFPVDLSSCVVDYKLVPYNEEDKEYKILLVAIPADIVEEYLSVTKSLGLNVKTIDFSSDSINRLYAKQNKKQGIENEEAEVNEASLSTAFIDIGATMTSITIATDDIIKYNKIINFGFSYLNHSFSIEKTLSEDNAERVKMNQDLFQIYSNSEPNDEDKLTKGIIADFIDSITVFFDFHSSRKTGNKIDKVILFGGGAYQRGVTEIIEDAFGTTVSRGFDLSGIYFDNKIENFDEKILCFYNCLGACAK